MAVVGLMAGMSTVSAPQSSAGIFNMGANRLAKFLFRPTPTTCNVHVATPWTSPNPDFATVGPDVKKALAKAGQFTVPELCKIRKKCVALYPNEPPGSRTIGLCQLGYISAAHVPMINGQPWADRPVLGGPALETMDNKCAAQSYTDLGHGTCLVSGLNYFYGLS